MVEPRLLKKHSHEYRVQVATEIARRLQEWYGEEIRAFAITGSVAKGEDGPYSDLGMLALTHMPVSEAQEFLDNGLCIEVDFHTVDEFLKEAGQVNDEWAIKTDEHRHQLVLFDRDGIFAQVAEISKTVADAFFPPAIRTQVAVFGEEPGKVLNAFERGDEATFRLHSTFFALASALLLGLLNRHYYASTRVLFAQAAQLPKRPPDLQAGLKVLLGVVPSSTAEIREVLLQLWNDLLALVEKEGIPLELSWEALLSPRRPR